MAAIEAAVWVMNVQHNNASILNQTAVQLQGKLTEIHDGNAHMLEKLQKTITRGWQRLES